MDTTHLNERLRPRLERLYGDRAAACLGRIVRLAEQYAQRIPPRKAQWDQRDTLLITYGDMVSAHDEPPLRVLERWLGEVELDRLIGTVHLLPFFPYSSDDGFSVIDYRQVDPKLGDWPDVARLAERYHLMFDLVLNHVSAQSAWFEGYRMGREPFVDFFIEADPDDPRLRQVVRPRSLPLLTEVDTSRGTRHVWTTFSADQVDLNFAEPAVLVEMLDVLLGYAARGARIIRLDAIAYLWKRLGTPCIHLDETHEVVRLMRDVLDAVAPGTILLTETNVPHRENFSYFGRGDEAQMVYQFSLAPLLLEAFISGDATLLSRWLAELEPPPPGCTVLNFTASHDGIGVRPLEGLMPAERLERLVDTVHRRGGHVSTKRNPDGTDSPYELNITYFSALADPAQSGSADHVRRFLGTQAIMLALQGIPGIYFHSLVGTPNDTAGVARTGRARSINRRKLTVAELRQELSEKSSAAHRVLDGYRRLLAHRTAHPAFHPDGAQQVLATGKAAVLAFLRTSPADALLEASTSGGPAPQRSQGYPRGSAHQRILVLANCGHEPCHVDPGTLVDFTPRADLLSATREFSPIKLAPGQVAWLVG